MSVNNFNQKQIIEFSEVLHEVRVSWGLKADDADSFWKILILGKKTCENSLGKGFFGFAKNLIR